MQLSGGHADVFGDALYFLLSATFQLR